MSTFVRNRRTEEGAAFGMQHARFYEVELSKRPRTLDQVGVFKISPVAPMKPNIER